MSIRAEIVARVLDGRLKKLTPLVPGKVEVRKIYLTMNVVDALNGIDVTGHEARLFGLAQARLEQFIGGDEFVCRLPPSRKSSREKGVPALAMLEPADDQAWEFPIGTLRLFGRFAVKDVFIVTNWGLRQLLDDDEIKWRFVIQTCKSEWTKLFQPFNPLSGTHLHEYLSNARTPV